MKQVTVFLLALHLRDGQRGIAALRFFDGSVHGQRGGTRTAAIRSRDKMADRQRQAPSRVLDELKPWVR